MKRITMILAFIGMMGLQSCSNDDDRRDNDTISQVIEVTTSFSAANNFNRLVTINPPIYSSDMILVYHLYDVVNGTDVWRLMPQTYYFDAGGELDYNFDFTRYDVSIFMDANFDMNTLPSAWTQNQTFRIVIVPAAFKTSKTVDHNDYDATLKAYNIDPLNIRKITE